MSSRLAFSGTGLYVPGTGYRCELRQVHHDVHLADYAAQVVSSQEFFNDLGTSVELIYLFPLDPLSTPYDCRVEIVDTRSGVTRVLKAVIKGEAQAAEVYDDAIASGGTALLMEKASDGLLGLSIGNVGESNLVRIIFSYLLELEVEKSDLDDTDVVRLQMTLQAMRQLRASSPTSPRQTLAVTASLLTPGSVVAGLVSPSHPDQVVSRVVSETVAKLETTESVSVEADFVVQLKVCNYPVVSWLVEDTKKESGFAHMVSLLPQFGEDEREEVWSEMIVIVDRSGSMSGQRMRFARSALLLFLQSLDPDQKIKFNIISFGGDCTQLFETPRELSQDTFQIALDHIRGMKGDMGGTNILQPIRKVLEASISPNYSRQVFFLSDGEDSHNSADIVKFVKKHSNTTRIFSFGIGKGIDPLLIDAIAKYSGGRSVFITSNDAIENAVMQQLSRALQPSLTKTLFQFSGLGDGVCVGDDEMQDRRVFNYQRDAAYFFSSNFLQSDARLLLTYSCGDSERSHDLIPTLIERTPLGRMVGRLAARSRIALLEKEDEGCDEILRLGLEFGLVSSRTSFVMVSKSLDETRSSEMVQVLSPSLRFNRPPKPPPRTILKTGKHGSAKRVNRPSAVDLIRSHVSRTRLRYREDTVDDSRSILSSVLSRPSSTTVGSSPSPSGGAVSSTLQQATLAGLWTNTDLVSEFVGCVAEEITSSIPSSLQVDLKFWLTAVVIVVLRTKHASEKIKWNLVVRKSLKTLTRNQKMSFLEDAGSFVERCC